MPWKPKRPCRQPGCPNLTDSGYCEAHKKENNALYEKYGRDRDARAFYNTARWKQLRKIQLGREPMCRHCYERGVIVLASHVDHIVEIADGGSEYDLDNLQSLCKPCHSSKTNRERKARDANSAKDKPKSRWETGDYKF